MSAEGEPSVRKAPYTKSSLVSFGVPTITAGVSVPEDSMVKHLPANAGDVSLIPGSGRFLGTGNGNPL